MLTDATEMNTPNVCASLACSSPSHCSGAGALMSRGPDRLDAVGAIICLIGMLVMRYGITFDRTLSIDVFPTVTIHKPGLQCVQ